MPRGRVRSAVSTVRTRDASAIPNARALRSHIDTLREIVRQAALASEDRRRWAPEKERGLNAKAAFRHATRLVVPNRSVRQDRASDVPAAIQFRDPDHVAICARRHARREVLHALRKVGAGSGRKRKRAVWKEYSDVRC